MAILVNKQPITLASGSMAFGPTNIQNNVDKIRVALGRNTTADPLLWPASLTTISVEVTISINDGPFMPFVGFTAEGGKKIGDDGVTESKESNVITTLPPGIKRKVQGSVTINNGPLVSHLTIEVV